MFAGIFIVLLYIVVILVGIAFMVFLIISLSRLISLKHEQNALLREMLQVMKEKKQTEE